MEGHPSYCRRVIPVTEKQSESHSDGGGTGGEESEARQDSEPQSQTETEAATETDPETVTELPEETEMLSEEDLDAALEETEGQKTVDEESGLTLSTSSGGGSEALIFRGLERGESVSHGAGVCGTGSQSVTVRYHYPGHVLIMRITDLAL